MFDTIQYSFMSANSTTTSLDQICCFEDMVKPYDPAIEGLDDSLNFPEIETEIKIEPEIKQLEHPSPSSTLAVATIKIETPEEDKKLNIAVTEDLKDEKNDKLCRLYLWYFLIELLGIDGTEDIISWTNKDTLEFKIHDAKRLAVMWGNMHGRENMTYAKFSRALRYHYKKGVIQKVHKKRYCYQFLRCAKVKYVMEENAMKNKAKFNEKVKQEVISNNKANEAKKQQQATKNSTSNTNTKKSFSKTDSTAQYLELPRPESRASFSSDDSSSHTSELPDDFEMEDVSTMDLNIAEYLSSGDLTRDVPDIRVQDLVEEMQASDQMIMNNSTNTRSVDQNSYTFYQQSPMSSQYMGFYQQTYQQSLPENQQPTSYMQQQRQQQQQIQQETTFLRQQQHQSLPDLSTQISQDYMSCCTMPSFGQQLSMPGLISSSVFDPFSTVPPAANCGTGINLNQDTVPSIDLSFISESMNLYTN